MNTQSLSRRNVLVSTIGFLLIVATLIGCGVFFNVNRVGGLDPVILTQDHFQMMGLTESNRIWDLYDSSMTQVASRHRVGAPIKQPPVVVGFKQRGDQLTVEYWLFDSSSAAKEAGASAWTWTYAAVPNHHPELNPEDVIGDATWRCIHTSRKGWEKGPTDIWFVKYNVLVGVRTRGHPSDRLHFARDVARKIEAKIDAVLEKK